MFRMQRQKQRVAELLGGRPGGAAAFHLLGWEAQTPKSLGSMCLIGKQLLCQEPKELVGKGMCTETRCHCSPVFIINFKWSVTSSVGESGGDRGTLLRADGVTSLFRASRSTCRDKAAHGLCPHNSASSAQCLEIL